MSTSAKLASVALRVPAGLFILNSALGKFGLNREAAEGLQGMAATGIPALGKLDPEQFGRGLAVSGAAVAGALLAPFVSNRLAGAALGSFGAGMLTMYFNNDAMTEDDGIRPSHDGLSLAKDSWLVSMGAALMALPKKRK